MKLGIPKEYMLEQPAQYDEMRFRLHYKGTRTVHSIMDIYEVRSKLFLSFFNNKEHRTIVTDIFKYVVDTVDDPEDEQKIFELFIFYMYEAGFFG